MRKNEKNCEKQDGFCEKFGKIAKNSVVLVNFVCVLGTLYRNEKSSQKKSDFSRCWYEICA